MSGFRDTSSASHQDDQRVSSSRVAGLHASHRYIFPYGDLKSEISEPKVTTPEEQESISPYSGSKRARSQTEASPPTMTLTAIESLAKILEKGKGKKNNEEDLSELSMRLEQTKEQIIQRYMQFFEKHDKEVREILIQLPEVLKHLEGSSTEEIKLGLDNAKVMTLGIDKDDIKLIKAYEEDTRIADLSTPDKLKKIESFKQELEDEKNMKETTYERKEFLDEELKIAGKHIKYIKAQEQYIELGEAVKNYKNKRRAIMNLPNLQDIQSG